MCIEIESEPIFHAETQARLLRLRQIYPKALAPIKIGESSKFWNIEVHNQQEHLGTVVYFVRIEIFLRLRVENNCAYT